MVKPWELDTILWKVCSVGREMSADWLWIHRSRTESKLLAKTMRWESDKRRLYVDKIFKVYLLCFPVALEIPVHISWTTRVPPWHARFPAG